MMNAKRRHLLHLAAFPAACALPTLGWTAVGDKSGAPDRKVVDQAFWSGNLSCDNAAVPASERSTRLATVADFGSSPSCTMLKNSVEGPFYFCANPGSADIAQGKPGAPLVIALSRNVGSESTSGVSSLTLLSCSSRATCRSRG
jgi:hypothetical protein